MCPLVQLCYSHILSNISRWLSLCLYLRALVSLLISAFQGFQLSYSSAGFPPSRRAFQDLFYIHALQDNISCISILLISSKSVHSTSAYISKHSSCTLFYPKVMQAFPLHLCIPLSTVSRVSVSNYACQGSRSICSFHQKLYQTTSGNPCVSAGSHSCAEMAT